MGFWSREEGKRRARIGTWLSLFQGAGGLMAFTVSMDEFIVTYFTSGPNSVTLPHRIFDRVKKGLEASLNASRRCSS
jgi:hypothetical protein